MGRGVYPPLLKLRNAVSNLTATRDVFGKATCLLTMHKMYVFELWVKPAASNIQKKQFFTKNSNFFLQIKNIFNCWILWHSYRWQIEFANKTFLSRKIVPLKMTIIYHWKQTLVSFTCYDFKWWKIYKYFVCWML